MGKREKVILQDFTVLLVCPSFKWSTLERRVLFDSTFLRNMGCNPAILCFKGSQLDKEAESEDIPTVHISSKLTLYLGGQFYLELKRLINEQRFDIIHCYALFPMWISTLILGANTSSPLFLTFNQNPKTLFNGTLAKWLLRRVDYIFCFSYEVEEYLKETLPVPPKKLRTLGAGIEVVRGNKESKNILKVGCVISNLAEVRSLYFPIKTFRVLKNAHPEASQDVELYLFLGPRIFKKDKTKDVLAELDYEFYQGDIHLLHLKGQESKLKDIDLFFGTAFDEPINDYEMASLLNGTPVLFPRTAMRQVLLQNYDGIGESYHEKDSREARSKLLKMLSGLKEYQRSVEVFQEKISDIHGIDHYAEEFQKYYEMAFVKRMRIKDKRKKQKKQKDTSHS